MGAAFPPDLAAGFKGLVGAAFLVCFVAGWLEGRAAALGAGLGRLVLGLAEGVGLVRWVEDGAFFKLIHLQRGCSWIPLSVGQKDLIPPLSEGPDMGEAFGKQGFVG